MGCQDVKLPKKPGNLIAKNEMIDILAEAYIVNAARSVDYRTVLSKGVKLDSLIYKKFGIDSLQFAESNAYYSSDINTYLDMFQQIEAKLGVWKNKLDSLQIVQRKLDSINKIPKAERAAEPVRDSLI